MNYDPRFIELASEINTNMPRYVVSQILDAMNDRGKVLKGSKVLVLGVAYKPDINGGAAEYTTLDVIALLKEKRRAGSYHDPYISQIHHEHEGWKMDSVKDAMKAVKESDAVVIVTNHKAYDYQAILSQAKFVFDSRNALGKLGKESGAGLIYGKVFGHRRGRLIGARTVQEMLIEDGHTVLGVDNLNDAYDPRMKEYRLKKLQALPEFRISSIGYF